MFMLDYMEGQRIENFEAQAQLISAFDEFTVADITRMPCTNARIMFAFPIQACLCSADNHRAFCCS